MIHTTIGVYNNGDRKVNGVPSEDLAAHIRYNTVMRFGRALFLDGLCIYNGCLSWERCKEIEKELAEKPIVMEKDTAPYH